MFRRAIALLSILVVGSFGCEEVVTPLRLDGGQEIPDSTTVPVGGSVDIIDGTRYYRNVHVVGRLTYHTDLVDELARSQGGTLGRIGVSLNLQLTFQRIDDYQGVSQYWHAGGKSYDLLELAEDGTAMIHKRYQLFGVTGLIAFVNVEYHISRVDVWVHSIWVSYEYP